MGAQTDRPPNEHPIILRLYGEIWPTTNVFQAGQQIRIDISTSDFPHFLPSLVPSENEILHDQDHPSRLILPVEPASVFRYLNEIACLNYQGRVCCFSYDSESVAIRNRCPSIYYGPSRAL